METTKDESVRSDDDRPTAEDLSEREKITLDAAVILVWIYVRLGTALDTILLYFREILARKEYQPYPQELKEKLAAKAVKARIAWEVRVQPKMFDIVVIGKSSPRPIKNGKNTIANLAAFCTPMEDDSEPFYRNLTFWDDVGAKVNKLLLGHRYHCNLVRNKSADSPIAWDPVDKTRFTDQGKFDGNLLALLNKVKNIKTIAIAEAEFNINDGYDDYQRINAMIIGHHTTSKGSRIMFVVDDSTEDLLYGGDDLPSGDFAMFLNTNDIAYGEGSEIAAIGRVRRGDDGRVSMNIDAIIPILAVPIPTDDMEDDEDYQIVGPTDFDLDDDEW